MPIGVSGPHFLAGTGNGAVIEKDNHYFFAKIAGAQACFRGKFWDMPKALLISSKVSMEHQRIADTPIRSILAVREVVKNQDIQLGCTDILVNLTPAILPGFSIGIEFILDRENAFGQMTSLINDRSFISAVGISAEAAGVAKSVGIISQKILSTFLTEEQKKPILSFSGNFQIASGDLQAGMYAIIGSQDDDYPLPDNYDGLRISDGRLFLGDEPMRNVSYVVIEIGRTSTRGESGASDSRWLKLLRSAKNDIDSAVENLLSEGEDLRIAYKNARTKIGQARVLLLSDENYLPAERDAIIKSTVAYCNDAVQTASVSWRSKKGHSYAEAIEEGSLPQEASLRNLGIHPDDDIVASAYHYNRAKDLDRKTIERIGLEG